MPRYRVYVEAERTTEYAMEVEAVDEDHAESIVDEMLDANGVEDMELIDTHTWKIRINPLNTEELP